MTEPMSNLSGGIGLGKAVAGLLATSFIGASLALGGNVYFKSAENTAPSLYSDSGSFLTYKETRLTASGANRLKAMIQVPSVFASGAVLQRINLECGNVRVAKNYAFSVNALNTKQMTGATVILARRATGTGFSISLSGAMIPSNLKLTASSYIFAVSGTGANHTMTDDCMLKTWMSEKYGR
jgi:hypothetical protein